MLWLLLGFFGVAAAQFTSYYYPQTYGYGTYPMYTNSYPFMGQYGMGNQFGYPTQMQTFQQPFYSGSQTVSGVPQLLSGSTVTAAQTTTATMPGTTHVIYPNQGFTPQMYQQQPAAMPVASNPILTQGLPAGTSVVQSNTVLEMEESGVAASTAPKPPAHFDYYAYARDGLEGGDHDGRGLGLGLGDSRRQFNKNRPMGYLGNGSPIQVTKPEHFEFSGYGRSETKEPEKESESS